MVKPFIAALGKGGLGKKLSAGKIFGKKKAGFAKLNGGEALESALREIVEGFEEMPAWEIVATAHYSSYVEFGTSRAPPQPFMQPAVDHAVARADMIWESSATPEDFMARFAFTIEAEARNNAPVDTGFLQGSISSRRLG